MPRLIGGRWDGREGRWTEPELRFPVRIGTARKEEVYDRTDAGDYQYRGVEDERSGESLTLEIVSGMEALRAAGFVPQRIVCSACQGYGYHDGFLQVVACRQCNGEKSITVLVAQVQAASKPSVVGRSGQ